MSMLDQQSTTEGELDFHNRGFLPGTHALIKPDQPHFGALSSMEPNPMSFYSAHNPVVSNGHTSPEMSAPNLNAVRGPLDEKEEIPNGVIGQVPAPGFNCPSPTTPGGKKSFLPDVAGDSHGSSGPAVVYPWMKRIHVSHGEFNLSFIFVYSTHFNPGLFCRKIVSVQAYFEFVSNIQ